MSRLKDAFLPNGRPARSGKEYIAAWRAFLRPIGNIFGHATSYDPGANFGTRVELSQAAIRKLNMALVCNEWGDWRPDE